MRLTLTINIINTTMKNKKNILISSKDSELSELLYECLSDFNVKYLDLNKIDVNSHESYKEIFKDVNIYIHLCHGGFNDSDTMKMIDYHTENASPEGPESTQHQLRQGAPESQNIIPGGWKMKAQRRNSAGVSRF